MKRQSVFMAIGSGLWGVFVAMMSPDLSRIRSLVCVGLGIAAVAFISWGAQSFLDSLSKGKTQDKKDS
jgi:hypothetical protein